MNTTQEVPQYVSSDEDAPEEATTSKKKTVEKGPTKYG